MAELIWDGKYDKQGRKSAPLRIALPFQTVETVNESENIRAKSLQELWNGKPGEWRNRLIWGDKKYVLPSLLPEFAGKVNLIYIDPPFATGANFSFRARIPDNPETNEDESSEFVKQASMIEEKAYRDTWGRGIDSYLQWFYETAVYLRELLADNGSIYVHLDWHVGHYAKAVLDDVFGLDGFINEVVWQKIRSSKQQTIGFGNVHDVIFLYSKFENLVFNKQYVPLSHERINVHYKYVDEKTGRRYQLADLTQQGKGPARQFGDRLIDPPPGKHWIWNQERITDALNEGIIVFTSGKMPRVKRYLDESKGNPMEDIWVDISPVNSQALERVDYDTQKPEALLDRILSASSNPGDFVLDCFVGSGTTAVVAEKLGRRWIACDLSRFAIHTTRKRLLGIEGCKPFVVQNLGKYERQMWMGVVFQNGSPPLTPPPDTGGGIEGQGASRFFPPGSRGGIEGGVEVSPTTPVGGDKGGVDEALHREATYRKFILDLYHAEPLTGYTHIHGIKHGRMVHVGSVDSPVTLDDVKKSASEMKQAIGTGEKAPTQAAVDILGWEFAFELNELAQDVAKEAGVQVVFKKIPRDVMDQKAIDQGDIKFFELAALSVDVKIDKRTVTLKLTDFAMPLDEVPEEVRKAITHWSQWIDYWAVDWNFREDTFHNQWQSFRKKKDPKLESQTEYTYEAPGNYDILIKVIDLFGNDTTKLLRVEVK